MSIHYLIDISKIYEEGLYIMGKYLSKKVPSIYLPLTLEQVDYRDPNKIRLTVNCSNISHTLFIIPDLYVLTDHNGMRLNFLDTTISSRSSILKSVCPAMRRGFTVTLQEDDYEFVSRKEKDSFILNNPLDPVNASIIFSNGQRGRKSTDLQCIYKALRRETMNFFSKNFEKPFPDDSACFVDIHHKNSNVIRDDTELVSALHAAKPRIKSRYRFSGNKIYYCRRETNVWEIIGEKKFDFQLRNYFTNTAELKLTRAELRHISMKKSMTNLRNYILGEVDTTDFANLLNSKLQLFITNNKTIDLSSTPPIIRHIEIEDLAKTTCGWSYNPDLAAIHKESVQSYFNTMFPEQSERDWFLSYIARFLNGKRMNEPFLILIDEHEDKTGKTTLMQLLKAVFGNYFIANSKVVTAGGNRDYNEYAGGLYGLKEKRLLLADGLQKTDTLNSGFIKAITGECHYQIKHVNKFFRTEFEFVVQAGLVILASEKNLPKFEKNDQNLLNKMVVCPLRSHFVTQEEFQEMRKNNDNMKNIKIADDSLELQSHEWRSAILDLLIEYSNKPILTIPDSMRHWKKRVCDMYFDYTDWLNKYIRKSENQNEFVSATQIMSKIQNSDSEFSHPREMQRLKIAMDEWAKRNNYKYKHRHVYPTEKGRRTETKSVLMNAKIDDVFEKLNYHNKPTGYY
uniref:AsIV-cont00012-ORF1 n=1 Tax=Apophua simplicipes ichnovirus TaxID=1329648 RepID=S5DSW1_9VIRU|nr:AsIV-cont00012-ORF1 [Apophua simplicipes ichnovirus]